MDEVATKIIEILKKHMKEPRETEITIRGAALVDISATTLAARDVHDHNTFNEPNRVVPTSAPVRVSGSPFVYRFPAASVTKLEVELRR